VETHWMENGLKEERLVSMKMEVIITYVTNKGNKKTISI
jgi:hypothetical protein